MVTKMASGESTGRTYEEAVDGAVRNAIARSGKDWRYLDGEFAVLSHSGAFYGEAIHHTVKVEVTWREF